MLGRKSAWLGLLAVLVSSCGPERAYIVALEPQEGANEDLASRCGELWYYSVDSDRRCVVPEGRFYLCGETLSQGSIDCRADPTGSPYWIANTLPPELWEAAGWSSCTPEDDARIARSGIGSPCE